jgi:hypothetical protein
MSVNRIHRKKHDFSIIANEGANDETLSWQAKGLLWYLLTKPDGWSIQTKNLINQTPGQKEKAVASILKELQQAGYLIRWCEHGEGGLFVWRSEIFECKEDAAKWALENNIPDLTVPPSGGDGTVPPSTGHRQTGHRSTVPRQGGYIVNNDLINNGLDQKLNRETVSQDFFEEPEPENQNPQPSVSVHKQPSSPIATNLQEDDRSADFSSTKNNATARFEERFAARTAAASNGVLLHPYPDLVSAGLGDIWVGPKRTDFSADVVASAQRHLKKHDRPAEVGDAKGFISNLIKQGDWAKLELLVEDARLHTETTQKAKALVQGCIPLQPQPVVDQPSLTPAEGMAIARAAMQRANEERQRQQQKREVAP